MSLVEMLPEIQSLPRADKLRLIQLLAQELAEAEAPPLLESGKDYPVWSPDQAFEAADTLLRALHTDEETPLKYGKTLIRPAKKP